MEAYWDARSTATAITTEDGTMLWSSPTWQDLVHAPHAWTGTDAGDAPHPQSLPEFLERCLSKVTSPNPCRYIAENSRLSQPSWDLNIKPLPGVTPALRVIELTPRVSEKNSTEGKEAGTLLLVDDEPNILNALRRSLRRSGHRILTASSGAEGLEILEQEDIDIIVSDQRMPNMTGVEFLRRARERWPQTVRISLSGYTDLKSISDAINEGAVFKYITKPWEDTTLLATLEDAFMRKRSTDQTHRLQLALTQANEELVRVNARLTTLLSEREGLMATGQATLETTHKVFSALPVPVLGLDSEGMIAIVNDAAETLLGPGLLGSQGNECLPTELDSLISKRCVGPSLFAHAGQLFRIICTPLGHGTAVVGTVLTLLEVKDKP